MVEHKQLIMDQTIKIHQYPTYLKQAAQEIAKIRVQKNTISRQNNPQYNRGDKDIYVDTIGILGEMLAQQLFFENGQRYTATPIVSEKPETGPDITTDEMTIDVKTTEKPYLTVNYDAHNNKSKDISHYLFVILLPNNTFITKFFKKQKIDSWEIKSHHTKYYAYQVTEFDILTKSATELYPLL